MEEGWITCPAELISFLKNSPDGCFVSEIDGQIVGGIMIFRHRETAWIGNFIVKYNYRGRGIGTGLFKQALIYLDAVSVKTTYLCAAPRAVSLYGRYNFKIIDKIQRWERVPAPASEKKAAILDIRSDINFLQQLDTRCWGDERKDLINQLASERRHINIPGGYLLYKSADQCLVGPWHGDGLSNDVNQKILYKLLSQNQFNTIILDSPSNNKIAQSLFLHHRFKQSASNYLMFRGIKPDVVFSNIFALASFGSKG